MHFDSLNVVNTACLPWGENNLLHVTNFSKKDFFSCSLCKDCDKVCIFRDDAVNSSHFSKGQVAEKVRAVPLGSSLLSCWRLQQWAIHLHHRDFADFKRLLAPTQQKRLLLCEGDGTDGWQESAEDANRLWSHRVAPTWLWLTAIAYSNCELDLVQQEQGGKLGR